MAFWRKSRTIFDSMQKKKGNNHYKEGSINNVPFEKLGYFNDGIFKVGKQTSKIDELKTIFYNGLDELIN